MVIFLRKAIYSFFYEGYSIKREEEIRNAVDEIRNNPEFKRYNQTREFKGEFFGYSYRSERSFLSPDSLLNLILSNSQTRKAKTLVRRIKLELEKRRLLNTA